MTYFEWEKRPPRKFRGKPQWTLDEVYISPFTARRRYDEEGIAHYDTVERNLKPTEVENMNMEKISLYQRQAVMAICFCNGMTAIRIIQGR